MKKIIILLMLGIIQLIFINSANAELTANNIVYCEVNGDYSSKEGTYIERKYANNSTLFWGVAGLKAVPDAGADTCFSANVYLYTRESGTRASNVADIDVGQYSYSSPSDVALEWDYRGSSYRSYGIKYKSVVKMKGLSGYQPNHIHLYTIP